MMNIIIKEQIKQKQKVVKDENTIFIRLVYLCNLNDDIKNIKLQVEEHTEYRLINSLKDLEGEKISPFLIELFNHDLEIN